MSHRKRQSILRNKQWMNKISNVGDFLSNYKETVAIESFQLATSLSPGAALQAVVESNHSVYPTLKKLADKTSVVSIPLPHEKSALESFVSKKEDSKPMHSSNIIYEDESYDSLQDKRNYQHKEQSLKNKIKNAKPKIPVQKKPKEKFIDPDVLIQIEKEKKRADAIVKMLDFKRVAYHEQAKRDAIQHSENSKKKVAELDAIHAKVIESRMSQIHHKSKFQDLPTHLIDGASNHFPIAEELKTKWYKSVSKDARYHNQNILGSDPHGNSKKHIDYLSQISERERLKKYKRRNANDNLYVNVFADANGTYVFRGLPDMNSLQRDITLDAETLYFFDFLTQKESLTKNKHAEKRKQDINRMSEQLIRNKQLANDAMQKMGLCVTSASPNQDKKEDDVKVNIFDEDASVVDGTERRNSIHLKSSISEDNNDVVLARRASSIIGTRIVEGSRRSFIPRRSFSAGGIELHVPQTPMKSILVEEMQEEDEDYTPTRKNSFFGTKSMTPSQDNSPMVSRRPSMRLYSRRASERAIDAFVTVINQTHDKLVQEEEEETGSWLPSDINISTLSNELQFSNEEMEIPIPVPIKREYVKRERIIEPLTYTEMLTIEKPERKAPFKTYKAFWIKREAQVIG